MSKIENDFLGLSDLHGKCVVGANIWSKSDVFTTVSIDSNSNKVKRAFNSKKRYSLDRTLDLAKSNLKKDSVELLQALMYRAKVAEDKKLYLGQRGMVSMGILNCK